MAGGWTEVTTDGRRLFGSRQCGGPGSQRSRSRHVANRGAWRHSSLVVCRPPGLGRGDGSVLNPSQRRAAAVRAQQTADRTCAAVWTGVNEGTLFGDGAAGACRPTVALRVRTEVSAHVQRPGRDNADTFLEIRRPSLIPAFDWRKNATEKNKCSLSVPVFSILILHFSGAAFSPNNPIHSLHHYFPRSEPRHQAKRQKFRGKRASQPLSARMPAAAAGQPLLT